MEFLRLGNSGLEVSRLGLGGIPHGTIDPDLSDRILGVFADAGGNFIDTANSYGGGYIGDHEGKAGNSERAIGRMVAGKRDRFVIASKGYWVMENDVTPNGVGLSRAYLAKHIDASLQRLNTDYIDLYQCHMPDFYTPVEETMRVLDDFVRAGKIRYVGVSNWDGWMVVKANAIARSRGYSQILSNQIWYTLIDRAAEFSLIPACRDEKVSIMIWSPLGNGFLSGRLKRGDPPLSSFADFKEGEMCSWEALNIDRNWDTLELVEKIAAAHGATVPMIALAWLFGCANADMVLTGSATEDEMQQSVRSESLKLSDEEMASLNEASKLPTPYPNAFYEPFSYQDRSPFYGGLR